MSLTASFNTGRIQLKVDKLLPLVLILIAFLLSRNYFPILIPGASPYDLYLAGVSGAFAIIISILIHEGGHALSATILHIPIKSIHINLFGGMAELKHRPLFPLQEFYVALAGPLTSFLVGLIFYLLVSAFEQPIGLAYAIIEFVAILNVALGAFNILPVFPLDGGRAVRSYFWYRHKNFYYASGMMHRFSSFFIGLIFILAVTSFWFELRYWSLFLGILGIYTSYLVMDAKRELITLPEFKDLIFKLPANASPALIMEKLIELQPDLLQRTIIPVIIGNEPQAVIYGNDLSSHFDSDPEIEKYLNPITEGCYIEKKDRSSFDKNVTFKADIIPVFEGKKLVGLADAQEARFWLTEMNP
jgi:Zn-dependent protease